MRRHRKGRGKSQVLVMEEEEEVEEVVVEAVQGAEGGATAQPWQSIVRERSGQTRCSEFHVFQSASIDL